MAHELDDPRHEDPCDVAPVDLMDRLLAGGVVVSSDLTVAVAGVDLVRVRMRDLARAVTVAERGD